MEQNEMVKLIEDAASQLKSLKADAELNNKIIATQEELIQLQYKAIEVRNQFIAVLESQLKVQDTYLSK